MNNFVIDACAWIEYFNGSKQGEEVKEIVENPKNSIYTNLITIAEISRFFRKAKREFEEARKVLSSLSYFYQIDIIFAEEAGKLNVDIKQERKNMSLADTFVLLTARKLNAKIITGDGDFKGLKEVIMLK